MAISSSETTTSYSSLLIGSLVAFSLSGIVWVQSIVYFKLYPRESELLKTLVCAVWLLDVLHSAFIGVSLYTYFVTWFGEESRIDEIPWQDSSALTPIINLTAFYRAVAFTVVITAAQTFIAHCFFANKIYRSSQKNWYLTAPIIVLAFARLIAASASTAEMYIDKRYSVFTHKSPGWIFTTGLTLSSAVDILIAAFLCYLLRKIRRQMGSTTMIKVVDTLTLYTLENGFLTCVATTASLICWVSMPKNLAFLGLHFVIEKLYANSILASLNTRKELRDMRPRISPWSDPNLPVLSADDFVNASPPRDPLGLLNPLDRYISASRPSTPTKLRMPLEVTVERVVEHESEDIRALAMGQSRRVSRTPTILSWKKHPNSVEYPDFDLSLP